MSSARGRFLDDVFSPKTFFGWCLLQKAVFWIMSSPRNRFWMMSSPRIRFFDDFFSRSRFWMMSSPISRFLDDFFSKKPFLEGVFSRKSFFGWYIFQEAVFRKNALWEIISLRCLENAWKNLRTVDPRIEAKNQGAKFQLKKAWPKSQARSFKKSIQISGRQPKNGAARFSAPRCCFEICIDFLMDFAWLFGWLDSLLACALRWLFPWIFGRQKNNFVKAAPKNIFSNSGENKHSFFFFFKADRQIRFFQKSSFVACRAETQFWVQ